VPPEAHRDLSASLSALLIFRMSLSQDRCALLRDMLWLQILNMPLSGGHSLGFRRIVARERDRQSFNEF